MNFHIPKPKHRGLQELNASDKLMTNHQRLKDREIQRAMDAGGDAAFLPTKSRAKRAGTTQKQIIDKYKKELEQSNANRMPMPDAPAES